MEAICLTVGSVFAICLISAAAVFWLKINEVSEDLAAVKQLLMRQEHASGKEGGLLSTVKDDKARAEVGEEGQHA